MSADVRRRALLAAATAAVNAYCDVLEATESTGTQEPKAPAPPARRRGPTPPEARPELDDTTKRALHREMLRHGLTKVARQRNG